MSSLWLFPLSDDKLHVKFNLHIFEQHWSAINHVCLDMFSLRLHRIEAE